MNNTRKSMIDVAVEIFKASSDPVPFPQLWKGIVEELELTEEEAKVKLPLFYTTLSLDGRFVVLSEDLWDLKSKHAFEEVHSDINDIYSEDEQDDDPEDGDDEEIEEKAKKKTEKDEEENSEESEDEEKSNREENY